MRPFLTLNVFGSKGCGTTTFKKEWFDSSQARAISEIADVHIRIQASTLWGHGYLGVSCRGWGFFMTRLLLRWGQLQVQNNATTE